MPRTTRDIEIQAQQFNQQATDLTDQIRNAGAALDAKTVTDLKRKAARLRGQIIMLGNELNQADTFVGQSGTRAKALIASALKTLQDV